MGTYTVYADSSAFIDASNPTTNYSEGITEELYEFDSRYLLVSFGSFPQELQYKTIAQLDFYAYISSAYSTSSIYCHVLESPFAESNVTYYTSPKMERYGWQSYQYIVPESYVKVELTADVVNLYNLLAYGTAVTNRAYDQQFISTTRATNIPYIIMHYDDQTVTGVIKSASPTSGYIPKTQANIFRWALGKSGECYGNITQTNAIFRWREYSGGQAEEISVGTSNYYYLPANSISTPSMQWQVQISTNTGETLISPWYTLSTVETLSTCSIVAPKNTIIDGREPQRLEWQHIISTGTEQTAAEIQTSTTGENWVDIASVEGAANHYTVSADTFANGQLYWRARTFNTDSAAGAWSDAANCIVINAPPAPTVSATQTPRPYITWQSVGQQAYQIRVAGFDSGALFGTATSYRMPLYISDGDYVINVRVQNQYGIWSEWGTCPLMIAHMEGDDINLAVASSHAAFMDWKTDGNYDAYIIYRDNIAIAKTRKKTYVDNFSVGKTEYKLRGIYDDSDDYGISNTVTKSISSETLIITDVVSPSWMSLPYSEKRASVQKIAHERVAEYRHFYGAAYPTAEKSEFYEKYMAFDVLFIDYLQAQNFEQLIGKTVCVKSRRNEMIIGELLELDKTVGDFYVSYTCRIRQIAFEEAIKL